jgi:hypothetical protein
MKKLIGSGSRFGDESQDSA